MPLQVFLDQLYNQIESIIEVINEEFVSLSLEELNKKESPEQWSILQCFEHLNLYNSYYLAEIENALAGVPTTSLKNQQPKYSWIGKKSIEMMHASNTKKQKTFKKMVPAPILSKEVLQEFLADQKKLKDLILRIENKSLDINRKAVRVEFFKLLKMRIGETLEFVVVHQQRHLHQALRIKRKTSAGILIV